MRQWIANVAQKNTEYIDKDTDFSQNREKYLAISGNKYRPNYGYKPAKCGSWKYQTYVNHTAFKTNSDLH